MTERINGKCIVEIKTADDRAVLKKELPEHYLWQGLWYCIASGIPEVCFLMVGKNQGIAKHKIVSLNKSWKDKIDAEIDELEDKWRWYQGAGEVPACQHRFSWEDAYCPFGDKAKKGA